MFTVAGVETHRGVVSTSSHVNMLTCKTQHKSIARKHNTLSPALPNPGRLYAQAELAATVTATARFTRHHALRYRTSLATPLATAVAEAVGANSDTAFHLPPGSHIGCVRFNLPWVIPGQPPVPCLWSDSLGGWPHANDVTTRAVSIRSFSFCQGLTRVRPREAK